MTVGVLRAVIALNHGLSACFNDKTAAIHSGIREYRMANRKQHLGSLRRRRKRICYIYSVQH